MQTINTKDYKLIHKLTHNLKLHCLNTPGIFVHQICDLFTILQFLKPVLLHFFAKCSKRYICGHKSGECNNISCTIATCPTDIKTSVINQLGVFGISQTKLFK